MGLKILAKDTVLIDEGPYDAEIIEYEEREMKHGATLVITFEIKNDRDFEGEEINGMCGFETLTPNTKLWKWAKAAGYEPVPEEEFDLDDLIGEMVSINVEHQKGAKDDNIYHRVESVTALRKKKRKASDDEEEDEPKTKKSRKGSSTGSSKGSSKRRKAEPEEEEEDKGKNDDDYFDED